MNNPKPLADEYGNLHYLADKLASGGQGVVYRTTDMDLAIKQPLNANGEPEQNAKLRTRFQNIRVLPFPPRIPITMPLAILRDEAGYVMRLLNPMRPLAVFDLDGKTRNELDKQPLPEWLAPWADVDKKFALRLFHYSLTGSTRLRLLALSKCASILARLHSAGLVYGDISDNNVFANISDGEDEKLRVWLIDADNVRFEMVEGGSGFFTPRYGAPEIVQGLDTSRPRTDCWAFAVLAFETIALCHPFIGKKVLEPDEDEGGWDAEPAADDIPADLDEQAYAGYMPFIDDEDDDTNPSLLSLPREFVATPGMRRLFQETFGSLSGRKQPHRRPAMAFWALELAKAYDHSLMCNNCKMSFFANNHKKCPYCDTPRPAFIRAYTQSWEIYIPADKKECSLPHRLFNHFSIEKNDDAEYEAVLDFAGKSASPVRGTKPFPENLQFDFAEAET